MTRISPAARRAGTVLFLVASFGFLGAALARQREQLLAYDWTVEPLGLALSALALLAALTASVLIWQLTLRGFGVRAPFAALARVWFVSSLGRYIPGKVWQFVGVIDMSRAAGIPALAGVSSLMVYMGFVLLSAWLVGIYLLPIEHSGPLEEFLPAARILSPLLLLALHPPLLGRATAWVAARTGRALQPWAGRWSDAALLLALSSLQWMLFGLAFALFAASLTELSLADYPALTAVFALAFVAGYVVVLAPAGLGAKEGALAILLSALTPLSVAVAVAVASRVWSIVVEILPALVLLRYRPGRPAYPVHSRTS